MPKSPLARLVPHLGRLGRATRWRRAKGKRPRVWAHRGDSAHAPENTMLAFETARLAGADAIELDVRLDKDGAVLVFHDDTLDRLCGRPGRLDALGFSEWKHLRIGGEPIPTLAEVLHTVELEIDIEIKSNKLGRMGALVEATAKIVADSGRADEILVSSFDPFALMQFHRRLPDIALAYLFHDQQLLPLRKGWVGSWTGASLVHPQHTLVTEKTVDAWHAAGLPINAWTVDDDDELRRLGRLGIDGVFANDPAHAVAILDALL